MILWSFASMLDRLLDRFDLLARCISFTQSFAYLVLILHLMFLIRIRDTLRLSSCWGTSINLFIIFEWITHAANSLNLMIYLLFVFFVLRGMSFGRMLGFTKCFCWRLQFVLKSIDAYVFITNRRTQLCWDDIDFLRFLKLRLQFLH